MLKEQPQVDTRSRRKPGAHSKRTALFRVAAVLLPLILLWGIPELVVRIVNPLLGSYRAIHFNGDPNSPFLFIKDPRLHWKLRPRTKVAFVGSIVRTDRRGFRGQDVSEPRRVALCLGDSTTFGWRVAQEESFPVRLEQHLNANRKAGTMPWQVINAGVPGYTSFQIRLLAERLIPDLRPEFVVVCIGNNEAWPVLKSDREIDDARRVTSKVLTLLAKSKFFVWASETVRREKQHSFFAPSFESAKPRVSLDEYEENLRYVVEMGRAQGATVVLATAPVNLYSKPRQFPRMREWEVFYASCQEKIENGKLDDVLATVEQKIEENPEHFYPVWLKGKLLSEMGQVDAGRELLEKSFEGHPFPERCRLSYRNIVTRVATDEAAPHLDINALFIENSNEPTPAHLYLDWCHPTSDGHQMVADALYRLVADK